MSNYHIIQPEKYAKDSAGHVWNAYAAPVGTYIFYPADNGITFGTGTWGIIAAIKARWNNIGNAYGMAVKPDLGGSELDELAIVPQISQTWINGSGVVSVNQGNGAWKVTITGEAPIAATFKLCGYID